LAVKATLQLPDLTRFYSFTTQRLKNSLKPLGRALRTVIETKQGGIRPHGVSQDLWVKAVAFAVAGQTGVIVSADALIIPREVAELAVRQVREARGVTRGAVYLSATHTHSSLGGCPVWPVRRCSALRTVSTASPSIRPR
jgi:hypothetical protein